MASPILTQSPDKKQSPQPDSTPTHREIVLRQWIAHTKSTIGALQLFQRCLENIQCVPFDIVYGPEFQAMMDVLIRAGLSDWLDGNIADTTTTAPSIDELSAVLGARYEV